MATATIVSAVNFLISHEHPTEVYRPYRPPQDGKFRKNWMTMGVIRGRKNKVGHQKARVGALIRKLFEKSADANLGVALIHRLRIQATIIGLFGLNSHFSDFLNEDISLHPGWNDLDAFSGPVANKFGDAIQAFVIGKSDEGDKLFDRADEMFGRLRHALWCAINTKPALAAKLELHQ